MSDKTEKGATNETKGTEGASKRSPLLIVLVLTNLLVVVGAVGTVVFMMTRSNPAAAEEAAPESEVLGPLVEVAPLVVNVRGEDGHHFMRAGFQLELTGDEHRAEVESRLVPIRSAILLYLSGLEVEETIGTEPRAVVLERVIELANSQAGAPLVRRAYFTDFVVQ